MIVSPCSAPTFSSVLHQQQDGHRQEKEREGLHIRLRTHHGDVIPAELQAPVTMTTWDPKHIISQFSEQVRKLIKFPRRPCSCSTCISELGHSLWFDQRFNSTMQPFLTSQNALIPEDSYRWWLKLQGEKSPKNINDTLKELFGIIPGDRDPLQERGTFSCRRCAVVGNSGNLRQSQYGQDIDSHDFVLRMNRAPTIGYESDVGSKTTHHFVYPESYKELAENVEHDRDPLPQE